MSTTNPTDLFLVNRSDVSYYVTQANLMAQIKDTDLMLINRDDVSYKITGVDVKKSLVDPIELTVTLAPTLPVVGTVETATAIVGGGKEPDSGYVFSYQWSTATDATGTGKVDINGATNSTYTPVQSDSDKYLGCTVTTADAFGTSASTTTYAGPVDPGEKEPDITSVTLTEADGTDNDRFTSSLFPYTVDMSEEGKPDPTYALKAKLTGATFDFGVKSSTITGVANTVIPGGWTSASAAENNAWQSVTYGGDKFVAVGYGGTNRVMYSTDGLSWTAAAATEANSWTSVTYGNGKFVAVGYDGTGDRVMYSTDGISWTSASAPGDNGWYAVTYGNGKFVAVAYTGTNRAMYSTDAINWTVSASAAADSNWQSVTYGNGKFVAVSDVGSNRVMYSTDGINWTSASAAEPNYWYSVTYGGDKFVAVSASGTNRVMYSTDGINWTSASAAENNGWQGVTYGNGKFVAVAYTGTNLVMYSTDGINWTSASAAENNGWHGVTYGDGKFVSVAYGGTNRVMWSLTGTDSYEATALTCASNSNLDKLNTEGGAVFMTDGDIASDGTYAIASYQPTSSAITTAVEDPGFNPISGAAVVNRGSFIGAPENIFKGLQPEVGSSLAGGYSAYTFGVNSSDSGNDGEAYIPVSVPAGNYSILCYSGQAANVTIGMQTNNISPLGQWTLVSFTDGFTPSSLGVKDVTYGGIAVIAGLYNRTTGKYTSIVDASTDLTFADPCTDLQYFNVGDTVSANEGNDLYAALSPAFSTTLYSGDGSNRSINTGIDNTGKTLLWFKPTNVDSDHQLQSIEQGAGNWLSSNQSNRITSSSAIQAYTETGVNVNGSTYVNGSGKDYVAWNFRAAPGFLDIVSYKGDGVVGREVPHSLGSVPGMFIIKSTDVSGSWYVYHSSTGADYRLRLEKNEAATLKDTWDNTEPNQSVFVVDGQGSNVNNSGENYVAYLFADTPGTIKCSSYIGDGLIPRTIECGFKPGFVLIKSASATANWTLNDSERSNYLYANLPDKELNTAPNMVSNGFELLESGITNASGVKYIYVAIAEGATAGEFVPTGIVAEEPNTTNRTLKLNNTTGNWADSTGFNTTIPASGAGGTWDSYTGSVATVSGTTGRWIGANAGSKAFSIAPVDGITEQTAEVYCKMQIIDDKAEVMGIQTTDPGFLNVTAKDYTIEFPALFTSGEAPDTALPAGTAITATVKAENTVGASVRESNTFIPQLIAPEGSAGPITGVAESIVNDSWNAVAATEANPWFGVTYGNGKFVAVAGGGTNRIMYSTDALSWTAATAPGPTPTQWNSVTYGNSKFVAVGQSGSPQVMYSTDGINWSEGQSSNDNVWKAITYGNNIFVAVSSNGSKPWMYSSDGSNWSTGATVDGTYSYSSVTYGDGKFVAVSAPGQAVAYSTDGNTWSILETALPESSSWKVTYGNGKFVAISSAGFAYSTDAISWTAVANNVSESTPQSITYGDGKFLVVNNASTDVLWSTDGINWNLATGTEANSWYSVTYGDGKFVAVASGGTNRVMWSTNGTGIVANLNTLTVGSSANLDGFVANDSLVMVDDTGAVASYTPTTTAITGVTDIPGGWTGATAAQANSWLFSNLR